MYIKNIEIKKITDILQGVLNSNTAWSINVCFLLHCPSSYKGH